MSDGGCDDALDDLVEECDNNLLEEVDRRACGFWFAGYTTDAKEWTERIVTHEALDVLNSILQPGEQYLLDSIRSVACDPPDCMAKTEDSRNVGIEVTELFDGDAYYKSIETPDGKLKLIKGRFVGERVKELFGEGHYYTQLGVPAYKDWTYEEFRQNVFNDVLKKDKKMRTAFESNVFDKLVLIIHTDEFMLNHHTVKDWVNRLETLNLSCIDEAYILTSYEPPNGYQIVKLPICKAC